MNRSYLSIGSNLGNRVANLEQVLEALSQRGQLIICSSWYESEAWGFQSRHSFLNGCVLWESALSLEESMHFFQEIERSLGRQKSTSESYTDRLVDIDLIFFNALILNTPEITVPHPRYALRKFVLLPLIEIAPDFIDPVQGQWLSQILDQCPDSSDVRLFLTNN